MLKSSDLIIMAKTHEVPQNLDVELIDLSMAIDRLEAMVAHKWGEPSPDLSHMLTRACAMLEIRPIPEIKGLEKLVALKTGIKSSSPNETIIRASKIVGDLL